MTFISVWPLSIGPNWYTFVQERVSEAIILLLKVKLIILMLNGPSVQRPLCNSRDGLCIIHKALIWKMVPSLLDLA